jgi:NADH:ubiquinone oxidoreductase subunit K
MDVAGDTTETSMRRPLFLPTARQTNWLLIVGFLALGQALYIRYMGLENVTTSLACQGGLDTWFCGAFRLSIVLFNHGVFGLVALAVALLNLLRPSIVLVAFTLAVAAFGVVLHNADLSSLAVGVLLLSLARPAPAAA